MQVADEAAADGLLSEDELADTVAELRGTFAAALAALGVNPSTVPEVRLDDSEEEEEEEEERRLGQARERAWIFCAGERADKRHAYGAAAPPVSPCWQRGVLHHPGQRFHGPDARHCVEPAGGTRGGESTGAGQGGGRVLHQQPHRRAPRLPALPGQLVGAAAAHLARRGGGE